MCVHLSCTQVSITCPLLHELLKYVITSDHAGQNKPDIPRISQAMHAYAQSFSVDRHLVPLPDNGQLMREWLEGVASGQGRRLDLMPSAAFAERYPGRAELIPKVRPVPDDTLVAARA